MPNLDESFVSSLILLGVVGVALVLFKRALTPPTVATPQTVASDPFGLQSGAGGLLPPGYAGTVAM